MEHKWRIEKRDVWAFPLIENPDVYGIRLDNTGRGFIASEPEATLEPEEFVWGQNVDPSEFDARTKEQWLAMLESWLADAHSDLSFSLRAFAMDTHALDKEAIVCGRGNTQIFEQCLQATLLVNDEFMRAVEHQHQTSRAGAFSKFGIIIRFDEVGVLNYSLWPIDKAFESAQTSILEQLSGIIDWFTPRRDEDKINRYTALRRRIIGEHHPHQIVIDYESHPLSAHQRAERVQQVKSLLHSHFSPDEVASVLELVLTRS